MDRLRKVSLPKFLKGSNPSKAPPSRPVIRHANPNLPGTHESVEHPHVLKHVKSMPDALLNPRPAPAPPLPPMPSQSKDKSSPNHPAAENRRPKYNRGRPLRKEDIVHPPQPLADVRRNDERVALRYGPNVAVVGRSRAEPTDQGQFVYDRPPREPVQYRAPVTGPGLQRDGSYSRPTREAYRYLENPRPAPPPPLDMQHLFARETPEDQLPPLPARSPLRAQPPPSRPARSPARPARSRTPHRDESALPALPLPAPPALPTVLMQKAVHAHQQAHVVVEPHRKSMMVAVEVFPATEAPPPVPRFHRGEKVHRGEGRRAGERQRATTGPSEPQGHTWRAMDWRRAELELAQAKARVGMPHRTVAEQMLYDERGYTSLRR
ncbi:hypothetical protein BV25DRAFT_1521804 [Artomyces pyxidatus]|uniref:Uncharacterized protein n=1 Tax=Artomyces pyxidatus TaxID=48021 RepID=A0ACB8TCW8_9AGAM|nr:hypothetical protein BV25DRAFT_1521804 [Artomyces pyxidatus]